MAVLYYDFLKITRYKIKNSRYKTMKNHSQYPKMIEIETYNRCNNTCSFCPVNRISEKRTEEHMSQELFEKIINELSSIDYKGMLFLYSNNEPLLDTRIYDFVKIAREKIFNSKLSIWTNGILLTEEKFLFLVQNLDELIIDNYNDNLNLIKPVQKIYDKYKNDFSNKVKINLRLRNEILTNRGGYSPNRRKNFLQKFIGNIPCPLVFSQFVIRPSGKISLCCNDVYGENTLGNLNNDSIQKIWNNDFYRTLRKLMIKGRKNIKFCSNCTSIW